MHPAHQLMFEQFIVKILSGELEPQSGHIHVSPGERLSILKQDHFAFEQD